MSPAPRAIVVLAVIALSALVLPVGVAVLLAVALVAAVAVDARAARRPPAVTRTVPEVLSRGVAAPLRVDAPAPTGGSVRVRQAAPQALEVSPKEGEDGLVATVVATRRGKHRLPAVSTRTTGPLKLARWDHRTTDV